VDVSRAFKEGEGALWREYALRFHHLPAHTWFASAVETVIDQKRCLFVGDAFLPPDVDGGSGGWSGLNRALPADVAVAANLLLRIKPDWILASRGGSFEFNEADARRRLAWAQSAGAAADQLSPSGEHRKDWDPQLVRVEPFLSRSAAGRDAGVELVVRNPEQRPVSLQVRVQGREIAADLVRKVDVAAEGSARVPLTLKVAERVMAGRYPLAIRVYEGGVERGDDPVMIVDVTGGGR
jgi:hypothetical protein